MNNKNFRHNRPFLQIDHPRKHGLTAILFWRIPNLLCLVIPCCSLLFSSCALGPDFNPPKPVVPGQWTEPTPPSIESAIHANHDLAQWWTIFNDPQLTSLIGRAIQANLDLKIAENRIRQARATLLITGANLGPAVDGSAIYSRDQKPTPASNVSGDTTNLYQIGFDASWEIDLFGGIQREIEASAADLEAVTETRRDVMVSLSAEVTTNYLNLRSLQQRLNIARRSLTAYEHTAELTRKRWQAGFARKLDMVQAEAQVATASGQIPLLESQIKQTIYGLSLLLGEAPASLLGELLPDVALPVASANVPLGLPSELLRRRPDIRKAEANVHAATARIGVAIADLFPKFSITGTLGLQNNTLDSTFNQVSRTWSMAPAINWPIFDMGRTQGNIELKKAVREEELLNYQQTVLAALKEVESTLIAANKEEEHRKSLVTAVMANRTTLNIATTTYNTGENDFFSVLDTQRSLYTAEEALAQSNYAVSAHIVSLFKALGGGWVIDKNTGGGRSSES